jgi:hypothetical protein
MADVPSPKKRTARSGKTAKTKKTKKTIGKPVKTKSAQAKEHPYAALDRTREQLKKIGERITHISDTKEAHDLLNATRSQLGKLGDKLHEAADKGMHMVKDIAEEVHRFSHDATELTKIRIEIHNLKSDKNNLLTVMGEKLRNLHKAKKLANIKPKFKYDFNKLDELDKKISEKTKEADLLSLDIKEI